MNNLRAKILQLLFILDIILDLICIYLDMMQNYNSAATYYNVNTNLRNSDNLGK